MLITKEEIQLWKGFTSIEGETVTRLLATLEAANDIIQGYASLPDGTYYGPDDIYTDLGESAREYLERVK